MSSKSENTIKKPFLKIVVGLWRWVVERTFAWLENARHLCRNYEELPEHHESFIYIAMIRLMLRKLTDNRRTRSSVTVL